LRPSATTGSPLRALFLLSALALIGCDKDVADDTAAAPFTGDGLTLGGLYHLTTSQTPNPPTVGNAALAMTRALAADETPVEAADITVSVFDLTNSPIPAQPFTGMEGGGDYVASWVYPESGTYTVRVDISDDTHGSDYAILTTTVQ